jgi:hypothetical protein
MAGYPQPLDSYPLCQQGEKHCNVIPNLIGLPGFRQAGNRFWAESQLSPYVDEAILQVSSNLLQRAIRMGHYGIGICLWLSSHGSSSL